MKTKRKTKDPILQKFGRRIRKLRKQKGLSQEGRADRVGLHWTYISGIERGLPRPAPLANLTKS